MWGNAADRNGEVHGSDASSAISGFPKEVIVSVGLALMNFLGEKGCSQFLSVSKCSLALGSV